MQNEGIELLAANNFRRYEISAFSKPGYECQHNLNYWHYGDYLSIGAGAHGKYMTTEKGFVRTSKKRHPNQYLAGEYLSSFNNLKQDDVIAEYFINRLRLFSGFSHEDFFARTGYSLDIVKPRLDQATEKKLLEKQYDNFRPTALGYQFLNDLVGIFL